MVRWMRRVGLAVAQTWRRVRIAVGLREVAFVLGLGCLHLGLWLWQPWVAWVVTGLILVGMALFWGGPPVPSARKER